jgi:GT2 family glycosyltransferase
MEWPVDTGQYDKAGEIEFAVGCCILFRADVLKEIGLLDDEYFAYFEELEWCFRARDAGYRCLYEPKAVAYHRTSHSQSARRSALYHYLNTRNWLHFWEERGVAPADWRRTRHVLIVWWHEIKFVMSETGARGARAWAVTRGAWDYLRGRRGPPPARLVRSRFPDQRERKGPGQEKGGSES